jgi:hypothetical protein
MSETSLASALSHNVRPEVFLKHYRTIRDIKSERKRLGSQEQIAKKNAKSDGVDLDALRLLDNLAKIDTDEAQMRLRHLFAYAQWAEVPFGTQLDIFGPAHNPPPAEQEKQAEWNAQQEGLKAGETGEPGDNNPHPPGASVHAAWAEAWKRGHDTWLKAQTKLAGELGKNAKAGKAAATPSPPPPAATRGRGKRANGAASRPAH